MFGALKDSPQEPRNNNESVGRQVRPTLGTTLSKVHEEKIGREKETNSRKSKIAAPCSS